jgi:tetratricopeptide (TPR) repeat protein
MSDKRRRQLRKQSDTTSFTGLTPRENSPASSSNGYATLRRIRIFLLALVMMVLGARPLFPSEGADLGDGLAVVMLVLGASTVCMTFLLGRSRFAIRIGWTDIAVLVVVLLAVVASVRGALVGTTRPGINMLWEWLGYGMIWFLVRQLRLDAKERRAILAGMAAIAVGVAAYGLYQYLIEFPALRQEYQIHRNEWLRSLGWDDLQANPIWLAQLENRLYSSEPLATFALTNSLAGFLLPWTVLILAVSLACGASPSQLVHGRDEMKKPNTSSVNSPKLDQTLFLVTRFVHSHRIVEIAVLLLFLCLLGICLILTKSRSAYLSLLVGIAILIGGSQLLCRRQWRVPVVIIVGLLCLAASVAVFLRGLDWAVLSEAGKSFTYRWQYWVATTNMIRDNPLFGCGPGNFRYVYLRYKLPEASEEVSDPHNFVLELAATVGLPAAIVLCFVLLRTGLKLVRLIRDEQAAANVIAPADLCAMAKEGTSVCQTSWSPEVIALGCGWILAWPGGWLFGLLSSAPQTGTYLLVGCPVAVLSLIALWPWIARGRWSPLVALASLIALGIHWLAAGGLTFPGVAYSFWLIWALSENMLDEGLATSQDVTKTPIDSRFEEAITNSKKWPKEISLQGVWAYAAGIGLGVTTFLCYYTAYAPVLDARGLLAEAARIKGFSRFQAEELLLKAAEADPWGYEAWLRLLELKVEEMRAQNDRPDLSKMDEKEQLKTTVSVATKNLAQELDNYALHLLKRARNHHAVRWNLAIAYQEYARMTGDKKALQQAIVYASQAITLYPYQASYHVGYAEILLQAGRLKEAQQAAKKALWLHNVTPHLDRKLPDETVANLNAILKMKLPADNRHPSLP